MGIHFRDLRSYQKDAYGLAIMYAYQNDGYITTKDVERLVRAVEPALFWQGTRVTDEIRSNASARFVIQALRGDGYLVTRHINGDPTVEYVLTNKFRDFFCRLGCYGEL